MRETLRHLRAGLGAVAALLVLGAGAASAAGGEFEVAEATAPIAPTDTLLAPSTPHLERRPNEVAYFGERPAPGPFAADRLQHASLAFSSGLAIGLVTEEPGIALGGAVALGAIKELLDRRFDRGDFAADLLGGALALLVTRALAH